MHCGWIRLAAGLLSSTLLVIITLVVLASGGVRSPGVGVYPSVIVMASLLLGGRTGLVFAGLSIVIGLGLLYAEIQGVLPLPPISLTAASAWVAQSVQAVVVAGLLFCTIRSVDSAQARARDTTHVQAERTRALQESRVLLETRARQQRAVAELGRRALASRDLTTLMDETATLVAHGLGVEYSKILELSPPANVLLLRAGVGWKAGCVGHVTVSAEADTLAGYTLLSNGPVIVEDLRTEMRFNGPPLLHEHGVISSLTVIIPGPERPFGVLGADTAKLRTFTQDDIHFLQSLANVLAAGIERMHVEGALRQSEKLFDTFMDNSPAIAYMKDEEGRYVYINGPFERLFNLKLADWQGKTDFDIWPTETAKQLRKHDVAVLTTNQTLEVVETIPREYGSYQWLSFKFPLTDPWGRRLLGGVAMDITARKQAEEALQTLSRQVLAAQEVERHRIARELHDEIGQALTAVKINLQAVPRMPDVPVLASCLEDTIGIIDRVLQQVRDLSLDLRPSLLDDLGLVAALRWYGDRQAQRVGFTVQFMTDPLDSRPSPDIETACFRVAQEALTNVARHAQAQRVWVEVRQHGTALHLVIRDDGIGFDIQAAQERAVRGASVGLLGMQERVQLAGGQITIQSTVGRGTEVHVCFPFK